MNMKPTKRIHNLDTLDREIYRLRLEAKNIEQKLDRNLDHFQEHYPSMAFHSFFSGKQRREEARSPFFDSLFRSEALSSVIGKFAEFAAGKAASAIEALLDKLSKKDKKDG